MKSFEATVIAQKNRGFYQNQKKNMQPITSLCSMNMGYLIEFRSYPSIQHQYQIQMTSKFSKEMEDKFNKDLEDIDINQISDLEDSFGQSYYQAHKKQIEDAVKTLKNKQQDNIINEVKKIQQMEEAFLDEFQDEVGELQNIIHNNQNNVIDENKLEEIKAKVINESRVQSIMLADEIIEKKASQRKKNEAKENKKIVEVKQVSVRDPFEEKIEKARLERENLSMEREDERSKKLQLHYLSEFFAERHFCPKIKNPVQTPTKIRIISATPEQTFISKRPLPNTQENVLSKNSPEMAMRRINRSKKIKLVASSSSKVAIKYKKLNPQNYAVEEIDKLSKQEKKDNIKKELESYLEKIEGTYDMMRKMTREYQPTFINEFQNKSEPVFMDNSPETKTLASCIDVLENEKLKDITFPFEKISDIASISQYPNIELIALQYNLLKELREVETCSKLIQLNVSHNKIKKIDALRNLKNLKILNIQQNEIEELDLRGGALEFLYAGHNKIQQIQSISENRYLKKLILNNNRLNSLRSLESDSLHLLQEINISKNYVKSLDGIDGCVMLRFLDASSNRIEQLYEGQKYFTFLFLNKLLLSNNKIVQIANLYLPSLEQLYVDKNKIEMETRGLIYLPELKVLNIDENKLNGFNCVYSFLRYSKNLQSLKYDKNTYFLEIREKVRELYEYIIYSNMNNLAILNQGPYDLGLKKYYEGAYSNYLTKGPMFCSSNEQFPEIHQKLMFNIRENKLISDLEEKKNQFSQTNVFMGYKSLRKIENLQEIIRFSQADAKNQDYYFTANDSLFYAYDSYTQKLRKSIHKIESMFVKFKYRQNKRKRYFREKSSQLKIILPQIDKFAFKMMLLQCIKGFKEPLEANNTRKREQEAAIIIQKNYKMYKTRKRFLRIIEKLKKKEEDEQMPEIDLDDFDNIETFEFDFEIPQQYNFEEYIIKPQIFEALQKKEQERNQKYKTSQPPKQQIKQEKMVNNYVNQNQSVASHHSRPQKNSYKEEIEKIMRNWNIEYEAAEAYYLKQKKKEKLKKIQTDKHLTATERYSKFKKNY